MKHISTFIYIFLFSSTTIYSQNYFSKLIKIHRDTAQVFFSGTVKNDSLYTFIGFVKNGKPSTSFAVFDTSLNYNREVYFPKLISNTNDTDSKSEQTFYKTGIEILPDGTFTDSQTLIAYNIDNHIMSKKNILKTGKPGESRSDLLYTYKDTTYLFSSYGYNNSQGSNKLIINMVDKDMKFIASKYINYPSQTYITDFIRNEKNIYILGIQDTIINNEYLDVFKLKKLDLKFNTIWDKNYETHDWADPFPGKMTFANDDIILGIYTDRAIIDPQVNPTNPVLLRIDPDGKVKWRKDFLYKFEAGIHTIKLLKNGDILFCGFNSNEEYNAKPGWMVRMKQNGDVIWNKMYIDKRAGDQLFGYLIDFHELEGGNIIAFGGWQQSDTTSTGIPTNYTTAWALKLGPDGCPGFDCGDVVFDYTLKGRDPITIDLLNIYPNPTSGLIYGDGANIYEDRTLTILNLTGIIVYEGKTKDLLSGIDINNLTPGVYFISVRGSEVKKIIKL